MKNLVTKVTQYENGTMGPVEVLEFFSELMTSGALDMMQGSYHQTAQSFVEGGMLNRDGTLPEDYVELVKSVVDI